MNILQCLSSDAPVVHDVAFAEKCEHIYSLYIFLARLYIYYKAFYTYHYIKTELN